MRKWRLLSLPMATRRVSGLATRVLLFWRQFRLMRSGSRRVVRLIDGTSLLSSIRGLVAVGWDGPGNN